MQAMPRLPELFDRESISAPGWFAVLERWAGAEALEAYTALRFYGRKKTAPAGAVHPDGCNLTRRRRWCRAGLRELLKAGLSHSTPAAGNTQG